MTHLDELVATLVTEDTSTTRRKRTQVKKFTNEQWEFIFELRCYGYTLAELGAWLGIPQNTLYYHFARLGFIATKRLPLSTYDEKLRKLGDIDV